MRRGMAQAVEDPLYSIRSIFPDEMVVILGYYEAAYDAKNTATTCSRRS